MQSKIEVLNLEFLCLSVVARMILMEELWSLENQSKIKSIEWLYLAAKGHRRAKFDLENNKDTWLIP